MEDFSVKLKRKKVLQGTQFSFALFRLVDSTPKFDCELGKIVDVNIPYHSFDFWNQVRALLDQHQVTGDVRKRIEEKIARNVPVLPKHDSTSLIARATKKAFDPKS